jgi:ABC-type transport system involved in multi-copper enzyme maturation permease subunit
MRLAGEKAKERLKMFEDYETDDRTSSFDAPSKPVVMPAQRVNLLLRIVLWVVVLFAAVVAAFFAAYVINGGFDSFPTMLEWIWSNLVG